MCFPPLCCTQFSIKLIQFTISTSILTWLLSRANLTIISNVPIAAILIIVVCSFSKQLVIRTPRDGNKKKQATTDEESLKELVHSPIVQHAWEAFCGNLVQEWIYDSWYSLITPDRQFPAEVRQLLNKAFQEITRRSLNINLKTLILQELSTLFTHQLELYRSTKSSLTNESLHSSSKERAFREVLRSNKRLHVALCSRDGQYQTLCRISEGVSSLIFTKVENLGLKVFARELSSKCVLSELIDLFTPYHVNKALLALLNSRNGHQNANSNKCHYESLNGQSLLEKQVQESIKQEEKELKESSRSVRGLRLRTSKSQPNLRSKDLIQTNTCIPRVFSTASEIHSLDFTSMKSSDLNNTIDTPSTPTSLRDPTDSTRSTGLDSEGSLESSEASNVCQGELSSAEFIGHPRACVVAPEINNNGRREYVVFKIRVADESGEWTVTRRYRNFEALHKLLRELPKYRQMDLRLPPKRFIHPSQKTEFVEQRRVALDRYLQGILSNEKLARNRDVWLFLSVQNHPLFRPDLSIGLWKSISANVENARYQLRRKIIDSFGWEARDIFPGEEEEEEEAFYELENKSRIESIKGKVGSSNKEDFRTSLQCRSSYSSFSSIVTPNESSLNKVSCLLHKRSSFEEKEAFLFENNGSAKTMRRQNRTPFLKSSSSGVLMNDCEHHMRVNSTSELSHLEQGDLNGIGLQNKAPKSALSRSRSDLEAMNNGMRKSKSCVKLSCESMLKIERESKDEVIASPVQTNSEDHPETTALLFNFIKAVFNISSQSVFTRLLFQVSHYIFSLLAGDDVIDMYLSQKLDLLSCEHSIAWMITSLKDCLWPNGIWFAKCKQKDNVSNDARSNSSRSVSNSDSIEEESDAKKISEELRVRLFENLPIAFASFLGQKDWIWAMKDVYDMLQLRTFVKQIGYGVLEVVLLALFPELDVLFKKLHNEAERDQEASE